MLTDEPTTAQWRGQTFRRELHARWAMIFHHCNITWDYSTHVYVVDDQPVAPAFWLPKLRLWAVACADETEVNVPALVAATLPDRGLPAYPHAAAAAPDGPRLLVLGPPTPCRRLALDDSGGEPVSAQPAVTFLASLHGNVTAGLGAFGVGSFTPQNAYAVIGCGQPGSPTEVHWLTYGKDWGTFSNGGALVGQSPPEQVAAGYAIGAVYDFRAGRAAI